MLLYRKVKTLGIINFKRKAAFHFSFVFVLSGVLFDLKSSISIITVIENHDATEYAIRLINLHTKVLRCLES